MMYPRAEALAALREAVAATVSNLAQPGAGNSKALDAAWTSVSNTLARNIRQTVSASAKLIVAGKPISNSRPPLFLRTWVEAPLEPGVDAAAHPRRLEPCERVLAVLEAATSGSPEMLAAVSELAHHDPLKDVFLSASSHGGNAPRLRCAWYLFTLIHAVAGNATNCCVQAGAAARSAVQVSGAVLESSSKNTAAAVPLSLGL